MISPSLRKISTEIIAGVIRPPPAMLRHIVSWCKAHDPETRHSSKGYLGTSIPFNLSGWQQAKLVDLSKVPKTNLTLAYVYSDPHQRFFDSGWTQGNWDPELFLLSIRVQPSVASLEKVVEHELVHVCQTLLSYSKDTFSDITIEDEINPVTFKQDLSCLPRRTRVPLVSDLEFYPRIQTEASRVIKKIKDNPHSTPREIVLDHIRNLGSLSYDLEESNSQVLRKKFTKLLLQELEHRGISFSQ